MAFHAETLQQLVRNAVSEKPGEDGTYFIDEKAYEKVIGYTDHYIKKSAHRSSRLDLEDLSQEIHTAIFNHFKLRGIFYQGKSVLDIIKMKTQNVTTNEFKKRTALKRRLDYPFENFTNVRNSEDIPEVINLDSPVYDERTGSHDFIHAKEELDPLTVLMLKEEITDRASKLDEEQLMRLCGESDMQEDTFCEEFTKHTVDYLQKATDNQKVNFLRFIVNSIAKKDILLDTALCVIFEEILNKTEEEKYHTIRTPNFNKKEPVMIQVGNFIDIADAFVGAQYVTPYMKKIEIIQKSNKKVKILVLATNDQIEVPPTYKVSPITNVIKNNSFENTSVEDDIAVEATENIEENNTNDEFIKDYALPVENESSTSQEESTYDNQTIVAKPKVRVEFEPEEVKEIQQDSQDDIFEENEVEAKTEEEESVVVSDDTEHTETKEKKKVNKKVAKRVGTAKSLVVELLSKSVLTKEELAKEIIKNKLTSSTEVSKVIAYVSVMLSNLKKEGTNLHSPERGTYCIKK